MRFALLLLSFGLLFKAEAQEVIVPAIVNRLYHEPREVMVFSYVPNKIIDLSDLPKNFQFSGQELIKSRKGLYLNPLGTGRIYQLKQKEEKYAWQRLDSTVYTGYNFGSKFFHIDTMIYSYGGQGFFNLNGNLRYFNDESKEWDAANISHSIPWLLRSGLYHQIDTSSKTLYVEAWPHFQNQSLKETINKELKESLWKLDIQSGEWSKLGTVNLDNIFVVGETPFGTLVNFTKIVDIKNNKLYEISKQMKDKIFKILGTSSNPHELAYSFFLDSTLYVGDTGTYLDSLVISRNDLVSSETKFYTPTKPALPVSERNLFLGIILALGCFCTYLLVRKKKGNYPTTTIAAIGTPSLEIEKEEKESQVVFRSGKLMELLNEREKLLLDFIYKHSLDERLTTIEEINKVIGASQRSAEVQKRLRSDLIGAINDKLEIISESKYNVVEKQRSEFDKRSFEYFIRPEHMELVEKVLGKKSS